MDFLYGKITPAWPDGFVPPEVWPEYGTLGDPASLCAREHVGINPRGTRWGLGPLVFEEYMSDKEPDMEASKHGCLARNRIIMWHRLLRTDIPKGWHLLSRRPWRVDGVIELRHDVDYTSTWNKNARRDLRLWREQFASTYVIERVDLQEYSTAYKNSLVAKRINMDRLYQLERRFETEAKEHINLWVVRSPQGKIIAGTAIIYSPTYKSSAHFSPFIVQEGRSVFAATALVDHWFAQTLQRGYRFAVSTNFWFPSQPKDWKGFSEFKSHFGFIFVEHSPTLYRFRRGKLY